MIAKLWTTEDVAEFLGVPISTFYSWRTQGYGPPGRKIGKHLRFKESDVLDWFENQPREVA